VVLESTSGVSRLLLVANFMLVSKSGGEYEDLFAVQDMDEWPLSVSQKIYVLFLNLLFVITVAVTHGATCRRLAS
jgi:hypothetical protein